MNSINTFNLCVNPHVRSENSYESIIVYLKIYSWFLVIVDNVYNSLILCVSWVSATITDESVSRSWMEVTIKLVSYKKK